MIPGLPTRLTDSTNFTLYLLSSEQNVDVHARVGAPSIAVTVDVVVAASVVISSSSASLPSLDLTGFTNGSTINLENNGDIIAAGGDGADGSVGAEFYDPGTWGFYGGGGGGGFGNVAGAGGDGFVSAGGTGTPGNAGSTTDPDVGGIAGVSDTGATGESYTGIQLAGDGGDCMLATGYLGDPSNLTLNLTNNGSIWPGGGGGGGGYWDDNVGSVNPTDGGISAVAGDPSPVGAGANPVMDVGSAGFYLRYSTLGVTINLLEQGDLRGVAFADSA